MHASEKSGVKGKKKILLVCVSIFMCALFSVTLFIYIRSFLPLRNPSVVGVTNYDASELLGHAGIKTGDRLYSIDLDAAEKKMLENCPYLETVELKRKFPATLIISVTEKIPQWYIAVSGDYYVLDTEFKIIQESTTNEVLIRLGVPQLVLPNLRSAICGELPDFGADETEIKKSLEVVYAVQSTAFKARLTLVDIESRFDVNIEVDGKYKVYMGDCSNISEKLEAVQKVLDSGRLSEFAGAEIDVSVPETVNVKPIY